MTTTANHQNCINGKENVIGARKDDDKESGLGTKLEDEPKTEQKVGRQINCSEDQSSFEYILDENFDPVASNIYLEKNGRIFDIRSNGKRIWIRCKGLTIKYPFVKDRYKSNSSEGTCVLNMNDMLRKTVTEVDQVVLDEFERLYKGQILNNIVMTTNSIRNDMYKPSMYNDTLRICVSPTNCGIFRSDGTQIMDPNISDILKSDTALSVIIEPAFAWMYNKKIGIHWDARQVKLDKVDFNHFPLFNNFFKDKKPSKPIVRTQDLTNHKQQSENVLTRKKNTFLFDESDDEDTLSSKEVNVQTAKEKFTLVFDEDSEDDN